LIQRNSVTVKLSATTFTKITAKATNQRPAAIMLPAPIADKATK
jgi:hypothetical protein